MLSHTNLVWTGESPARVVRLDPRRGRRHAPRVVPADGPHRRAHGHRTTAWSSSATRSRPVPSPRQIATYAREVHPNIMFGVPRVWEKVYAGVQAALAADPEKKEKFDEAVAAGAAHPGADHVGHGDRRGASPPTSSSTRWRSRPCASLRRPRRGASSPSPAPRRCRRRCSRGSAPSACRWPRSTGMSETTGPMTFAAVRGEGRHGRPRDPGRARCRLADDGEVICRGGNVFVGLPRRPGEDRRGARRRRLVPLRRHRRDRRRRLRPHRRPQEGADHHRRRARTSAPPTSRPRSRRSRSSGRPRRSATTDRSCRRSSCSTPRWRRRGPRSRASSSTRLADLAEHRRGRRRGRGRGSRRSMAGFNDAERVKKVHDPRRGVAARLRRAHADVEAQAPRHPRPLRGGDRRPLRLSGAEGRRRPVERVTGRSEQVVGNDDAEAGGDVAHR